MVQYAVLRWAHKYPDLLEWSDNIRLLETLSRYQLIAGEAADKLADAYRALRTASHRKSLQDSPAIVPDDELVEERKLVQDIWQITMVVC